MSHRILVADDDPVFSAMVPEWLTSESWAVEVARDGRKALDMLCAGRFDLALLDVYLPHLNGLEVLQAMRQKGIQTDVLMVTGYGFTELAVQAMKAGARDYIEKPMGPDELIPAVRQQLERRRPLLHVRAAQMEAYLQAHASDPSLTFNDLCAHLKLSPRHVFRLFREQIGAPFRRRLSHHRVQMARHLLEMTDAPLYSIAAQCGFKNQSRLTEAFHRLEGMSPMKYREICAVRRKKGS